MRAMERDAERDIDRDETVDSRTDEASPGPPWEGAEHWSEAFRVIGTGAAVLAAAAAWGVAAVFIGPRKAYWGVARHMAAVAYQRALKHAQDHLDETMLEGDLSEQDRVSEAAAPATGPATDSMEAPEVVVVPESPECKRARPFRTRVAAAVSHVGKEAKRPAAAVVIAGAEVLGTAVALGAAETALGVLAAFAVYRMLEKRKVRRAGRARAGMTGARPEQDQGSPETRRS